MCNGYKKCRYPDYDLADNMNQQIEEIYRSIEQGLSLVVATIIDSSSTPRSAGTKMIIYENGKISGTIGGGALEAAVIQSAFELFKTAGTEIVTYNHKQQEKTDQIGLICGGQMRVLIEHVSTCKESISLYDKACKKVKAGQPFLWIAKIIKKAGLWQVKREIQETSGTDCKLSVHEVDGQIHFIEPITENGTVYIMGAGHVSKEVAVLTKQIGLTTFVLDDRENFADGIRFPDLDGIYVCPEYKNVFKPFNINARSYIIIVTRSHELDKDVLAQALETDAGYIGMIGSRKKRETIYKELINKGFEKSSLEKVFCPIGLSIHAETPAEIGISIVAEIIQHRGNKKALEKGR